MARFTFEKNDFDFSNMHDRFTFQVQQPDGSYIDDITVWGYIVRYTFTRIETDPYYNIIVRDQKALQTLLDKSNKIKWKDQTFNIFNWQDLQYQYKKFVEIMAQQSATVVPGQIGSTSDATLFPDIVSIYRVQPIEVTQYGMTSYKYDYDFTTPLYSDVKCRFDSNRNEYLDDKKIEVVHDSLIVYFNASVPIQAKDYIIHPLQGKFKVDFVQKNDSNMIEAHVSRSDTL